VDTLTADTLVAAEVFGPTIQGEGPSAGRRCGFIRLGGCNLHCSWCDTPYTWDASRFDLHAELTRRPITDLAAAALAGGTRMTVITGGEPLLHQSQQAWLPLLDLLLDSGADTIEVETNGTQTPTPETTARVTRFNVSPKLAHAGDPASLRIAPDALAALRGTGKAIFKFVCRDPGDVTETAVFAARHQIPPRLVWIMPEGITAQVLSARAKALADPAIACGFNLTTRLHVLAWGDERGR
jgi:7-carboxy-7-deazaguanine synthase